MSRPRVSGSVRSLQTAGERRLAVRVTPDALRHIKAGHPWIFEESVTSISHEATTGDLGVIFDKNRKFVAIALYDPTSPIQFKVLHVGRPTPIDQPFWRAAITRALAIRSPFTDAPDAARLGYRVINGENDGMPGCVVDRYAGVLVVKLYSAAWFPHLADLTHALIDVTGCEGIVLRLARNLQRGETFGLTDGMRIAGEVPDEPIVFTEGGLEFEADVRAGQKTGHFLDQRANRALIGEMAAGHDMLDVFASTGGFSVHAAAGGARSVHAVDLSAPTLAVAERNMERNRSVAGIAECKFTSAVGDAFEVMVELARERVTYDLIVVDPPSFAQRQTEAEGALRAYTRLTHLALRLLRPGGVIMQASCSSRVTPEQFFSTVVAAADAAGRPLREIRRTGHDIDHPVTFREGEYLKAGFWSVGAGSTRH
ncbi:MAG: class I SAM-dependent rRNA methyltransferase [Ilumatobacteraceae bacterium]